MERDKNFNIDTKGLSILQWVVGIIGVVITIVFVLALLALSKTIGMFLVGSIIGIVVIVPYIIVYCLLQYSIDFAYNMTEQSNIQFNMLKVLKEINNNVNKQ